MIFQIRKADEWEEAEGLEELSGYTYESGIKWSTYANTRMRLRCTDVESSKVIFISAKICLKSDNAVFMIC